MANLLMTPANFTDGTISPPACWNGTSYVITNSPVTLRYTGTVNTGDTFTFNGISVLGVASYEASYQPAGSTVPIISGTIGETSQLYTANLTPGGSNYELAVNPGSGCVSDTATLTPPTLNAPDESITVAKNSTNNVISPTITESGSPVTANSLTIESQPANGTASVSSTSLLYTPNANYTGSDTFTYEATVNGQNSNIAHVYVTVPAVAPTPCQELGRVTKAYVSGYTRNRVHATNVFAQEKRCLTADFNGALPAARSIVSAQWSCYNPTIVNMLQGEVIGRETSVVIIAQYMGHSLIRCTAILDNGEQYTQMFSINVNRAPWFQGDPAPATGPYTVTYTQELA